MAGIGDVVSLGNFILACASTIQQLGSNWYKATAELKQFPGQVEQFKVQVEFWAKQARNRGLSSDPALIKCLQDAKSILQAEQDKLERRANNCGWTCYFRMKITVFPATLGLSIQAATIAFNNIPETLRLREEAVKALDRARMLMPVSESIANDSRYVPLQKSEAEVRDALDKSEGPTVVLLHGGAGTGKSTLARKMIYHYNSDGKEMFEHVFFLNCGPHAKAEDTLFELVQRLGSSYTPKSSPQEEKRSRRIRIGHQLSGLLAEQKILIILDDVHDGAFLNSIVEVCGTGVKCLVTSPLTSLCWSQAPSKHVDIKIQDISPEDARRMLASHVGLPNQQIPDHLQDLADSMLDHTERNPLAIASIANAIDNRRASETGEWEEASTNLSEALKSEVTAAVFEGKYSQSFWVTMKQAISTLSETARKLLLLTNACEGTSVPEEIVQILYKSAKFQCGRGLFSIARGELENRQLIKISSSPALDLTSSKDFGKRRTWSVHSLHKRFIDEEMKEQKAAMFTSLTQNDSEAITTTEDLLRDVEHVEETMVTTLCALYLEKELGSRAGSKMGVSLDNFSKLRRRVIEPITLLLVRSTSGHWTETARHSAMKVFVSYICNGIFHDEGISDLLGIPSATSTMWRVLKDIAFISEGSEANEPVLDENTPRLFNRLMDPDELEAVERDGEFASLQIISHLCKNPSTKLFLVGRPRYFTWLVNSLSKDENPDLQFYAAEVLGALARAHNNELRMKMTNHENALGTQLVNLLWKDTNPNLQEWVVWMLANLSQRPTYDLSGLKVLNFLDSSGAIEGLARLLYRYNRPSLLFGVAFIFSNLAQVDDSRSRMKLRESKGVMESLMTLMVDGTQLPDTQHCAACAFTLLDATQGNRQCLQSATAYSGRARSNSMLGMYIEALADLDSAHTLDPTDGQVLSHRCALKAEMRDFKGAMEDINQAISAFALQDESRGCRTYGLQERGVLKMMNDLHGALADLNESLELDTNDYECLKHRGFVKFKMNDMEGARADAELALRSKSPFEDSSQYSVTSTLTLGCTSVEFLEYKLK